MVSRKLGLDYSRLQIKRLDVYTMFLLPSIRKKKGSKPIDKENIARQDVTPNIAGDKNVFRQTPPNIAENKNVSRQDTTPDIAIRWFKQVIHKG